MAQVTLKQIAKKSGFSVTTVSRALGGFSDVNEETRKHIMSVADMLGYHPNIVARQLQKQRTDTIGVVNPSQFNHDGDDFFSILVKGVSYAAAQHQFDVLLCSQFPDTSEVDSYRRIVGGNRVDGVVIARTYLEDERIKYLESVNSPFVVAGRMGINQASDFSYIDVDSQAGIYELVKHFINYGHYHIGFIGSPNEVAFSGYRLTGYQSALADYQIALIDDYIVTGDLTRESGYQQANNLLERNPDITAIVACNDFMAIGAMKAIRDKGLRVGDDVAVGGFDGIYAASHTNPPLTTIQQPIFEIGSQLAESLIRIIRKETLGEDQILLQPKLIIRESSGRPRH